MYCNKCTQVRNYEQMINSRTGKINKLCNTCLRNQIEKMDIIPVESVEDISFTKFTMTQRIAFIIENDEDFDLKELFKELNFNILQSTGLYFRTTNIDKDHLYAKCRYGNNLQKKVVEKRKRNN